MTRFAREVEWLVVIKNRRVGFNPASTTQTIPGFAMAG